MNTNNTIHPETAATLSKLLHKWIDELDGNKLNTVFYLLKGFLCK